MINILKILAALPGLIKAVEEMFPQSGSGKDKLELVSNWILSVMPPDQQATWKPWIQNAISILVTMYNDLEIFNKPSVPAAAMPQIPVAAVGSVLPGFPSALPAAPAAAIDVGAANFGQSPLVPAAMASQPRSFTEA